MVRARLAIIVVLALLPGCGWWAKEEPVDARTASMREMLVHTPSSATITIAAPALNLFDALLTEFGLREYPVVQEALGTAGRLAGLDDTDSIEAIATALHLDSDAPIVLHLRPRTEDDQYDIVLMATSSDATTASTKAAEIAGAKENPEAPQTVAKGEAGAYYMDAGTLALSSSDAFLDECLNNSAPPLYGTKECPPTTAETIAFLIDRETAAQFARAQTLPILQDYFNSAVGEHIVTELWIEAEGPRITTRVQSPENAESTPLTLAPMLPPASESFIGWRMSKEGKDALREQWLATLPPSLENDPLYAMAATQLESFLHAIDDEVALAALGLEAARPQFVALFSLRDSNQAASLLGAFSPLFKEIAREEDTPVYGLPPEMGVPLAYALHEGVLIVGPDAAMVAGAVHQLTTGKPTALYESAIPPLDPSEPAAFRALLTQRLLADLVMPLLQGGDVDPRSLSLIEFVSQSEAIYVHRAQRNQWDTWNLKTIP